jgi:hypothetical protein
MSDSGLLPLPSADALPERSRTGRTGPTSPVGKARSSENAITHGCRSQKLILRNEDPAEFEALRDAWFRHYQPESEIAGALVEELVRAHWLLKRAQKHLEDVEWELPGNAYHWTEEHERMYRNFTRYKNSYERTFLRFFKEVETHCNRHTPTAEMKQSALAMAARLQAQYSAREEQTAFDPGAPDEAALPCDEAGEPSAKVQSFGPLPVPHCRT